MERVIKFRAWDISIEQMIFHDELLKGDGYYLMLSGKIKGMEYTGLLDKNGKEIYEGDILSDGLAVVEHHAPSFCFVWHDKLYKSIRGTRPEPMFQNTPIVMEVIGNIYENTDLIK